MKREDIPEGGGIIISLIIMIPLWALIAWLVIGCKTTTYDTYSQRDPIDYRKQNIYTDGEKTGYGMKDRIDPRRYNVYDSKGNVKGYWKQSPIDPRKRIFHKKK